MNSVSSIEPIIYFVRDQRVMMGSDLAFLYQVETKVLNQAVRRNLKRFPDDFMFKCDYGELDDLRSQIVTANPAKSWNHKRRSPPMLFTSHGVAMLSSVLSSERAIEVNILIMRTFAQLNSKSCEPILLREEIQQLQKGTNQIFKVVFERLDQIEEKIDPHLEPNRKKIGLNNQNKK